MPALVATAAQALRSVGVPARGETLVAALSGGPDSVALLDALATLRRPLGFRLVAAHLDHRLRPGSAEDAVFCESLCESLEVPLRQGRADVRARAARERGGLEQAARRERYAFLRQVKDEELAAAIAVAHTQDDQAETLLLRLLRGSGATGLGGMRPKSGDLVRPLLEVSRQQVLAHLAGRKLAFREDPTNAELRYRRNRVRHELIPYLAAQFNGRVVATLARTASLLADEASLLRAEADELLGRIARQDRAALVIDRSALARVPPALARAAILRAIGRAGGLRQVGRVHVERVLRLVRSPSPSGSTLALPGDREVRFTGRELRVEARAATPRKAVSSVPTP